MSLIIIEILKVTIDTHQGYRVTIVWSSLHTITNILGFLSIGVPEDQIFFWRGDPKFARILKKLPEHVLDGEF